MKNARGRDVEVRQVTRDDLRSLACRIASLVEGVRGLEGAIAIGSSVDSDPDEFSDLDLRFFADEPTGATAAIENVLDQAGGRRDDEADSIHFPLDYPARLLDGLYVEFTVSRLEDTRKQIDRVMRGQGIDDGLVHSLRVADILLDPAGQMATLQRYVLDLPCPEPYLSWITSVALDCDMKILRQAVAREDWHQAMTWLSRTCLSCAYVLFARNSRFFPGHKRLLSHTIPELDYQPLGFVEF